MLSISLLPAFLSTLSFAAAASKGCGIPHQPGYHNAGGPRTINSGGIDRVYGVFVPQSYNQDPWRPRRVIFDYHGRRGTPREQYTNSQYTNYGDGEEYLMIYPAGRGQSWQSAWYATDADDIQFTRDLLERIKERYCVDEEYVYASGKSNGGGFVDYLACDKAGDMFAAFAMASPALYNDTSFEACRPDKKRAIISSHSLADTVIEYNGESGDHPLPNIRTWVSWWAQRNGCSEQDVRVQNGYGFQQVDYSCGGKDKVVEHFAQQQNGHCWPDAQGDNADATRDYCKDRSLDYTRKVLDFFGRWSLGDL